MLDFLAYRPAQVYTFITTEKMVVKRLWVLKSLAKLGDHMSSSKSLAGQILRWFSDSRSDHKKDEQATGRPRTRGQRGSCPLDQESTLDMVYLDVILSGKKRSLGQQKVPNR
jgi:hypothetical protein